MTRIFDFNRPPAEPRGPWWRQLKFTPAMGVAVAMLVAGIAGSRFLSGTSNTTAPAEGSLRVNLNTATLTELESIPGIGDMLAKQIVAHRPYTSVDQLVAIRGIGQSSVDGLRPYVKVEGEAEKLR